MSTASPLSLAPPLSRAALSFTCLAVLATSAATGCKGKKQQQKKPSNSKPAPRALAGLEAIPSTVTALIGLDVVKLQRSWLVRRAVAQMFARDRALEKRIDELLSKCQIDLNGGVRDILIGLGAQTGNKRGTEEAVMVVTGAFVEAKLASCIGQSVAGDGRTLIADKIDGRTLYGVLGGGVTDKPAEAPPAPEPPRPSPTSPPTSPPPTNDVWFSVSGEDTLVVATSKDWLITSVGDGDKVGKAPAMTALMDRVDRSATVWAVGQMSPEVGVGLLQIAEGKIAAAPTAIFGSLDVKTGIVLSIGVEMASVADANALKSLAGGQMGLIALAAQSYGLGQWLGKLGVDVEQKTVYLRVSLNDDEVRQILSRIDTPAGSAQNPADNRGEP